MAMTSELAKADRLAAIQSTIGKALWQIQAFEDTLAHLIAIVLKIPPKTSLEEAEAILDDVRTGTLGRLVRETKSVIAFDDTTNVFMKRFVEERNWLVHRSWRTHGDFLNDEQEFIDLRYRISRLTADAIEFNQFFAGLVESYVRKAGVSEAEIKEILEGFTGVWR